MAAKPSDQNLTPGAKSARINPVRAIVIGAGEVGINVARTLSADGHDVTLIEKDPDLAAEVSGELDALVVQGNGASPRVLSREGAGEVDLLAAVSQVDEVNIIAALSANQLGAKTTVARVRDPDYFGDNESFARQVLGIDFVIDPDLATAEDISQALLLPGAVSVEYFGDGRLGLAEVIATEDSELLGSTLAERQRPEPSYIVGVVHEGKAHLARGDDQIVPGDHVLVVAAREHIAKTVGRFAGRTREVRKCLIFGGGKIGIRLADILSGTNVQVTILEADGERARFLAEELPDALVLHDEGVSSASQQSAGVGEADAFVACAGDDRINLLAALEAKRQGVDLSISVVSREEFVPLVDALAIDAAFSPRLITAEAILRFVHTESLRAMHLLRSGFEALELEADQGSPIEGQAIGDTHGILAGCRVGAILRDGEVIVPRKGTTIEAGDRVLMLGVNGTIEDVEASFNAA